MTGQHPEAGAADDGVLRRALDVVPVGQVADPELEGRLLLHAGITSRGLGEDGAFAAAEAGAALVAAAGVDELAFLRPVAELLDVLHLRRPVEYQLGVEPRKAVLLGGEGHVVPGAEGFQVDPGRSEAHTSELQSLMRSSYAV